MNPSYAGVAQLVELDASLTSRSIAALLVVGSSPTIRTSPDMGRSDRVVSAREAHNHLVPAIALNGSYGSSLGIDETQ